MSRSSGSGTRLQLALLRARRATTDGLRGALERHGLQIALDASLERFVHGLGWQQGQVDALLLDLQQADETEFALLDELLERVALPIVFHDGENRAFDEVRLQRLVDKIHAAVTAQAHDRAARQAAAAALGTDTALRCWVLGASFGGPEALKRFLGAFPAPPAATAFIIGQHIGDGFVEVLADQLNRRSVFQVAPAHDGARIESGRIYVAPVLEQMRIDAEGRIRLEKNTEPQVYLPSIDRLMQQVAQRFGRRSGAIIFSGMGDDGARGSVAIQRAGGVVWAQSAASCACDSMPNCARATGTVSREGGPEELARALSDYLASNIPIAGVQIA